MSHGNIHDLPGFDKKRGHKVPTSHNAATESFVDRIGEDNVAHRANELYEKIKSGFSYIRQDIRLDHSGSSATIKTKDFDVNLEIHQSNDEPSKYVETLSVSNFLSGDVIATEEFNEVFVGEVSMLRLKFSIAIDITGFIDAVEKVKDSQIKLKYTSDLSSCSFTIEGIKAVFVIRPKSLRVHLSGKQPQELVETLLQASKATLLDSAHVALLPGGAVSSKK